jgi:hypothetical protein
MKVKLKNKKNLLSSKNSHCELSYDNWFNLNNGKTVELNAIPKLIKEQLTEVKKESK